VRLDHLLSKEESGRNLFLKLKVSKAHMMEIKNLTVIDEKAIDWFAVE